MRLEITELSTHLQGQLVAVHPAYDALFDSLHRKNSAIIPKARTEWLFNNYTMPQKPHKPGFECTRPLAARCYGLRFIPGLNGLRVW
jgi:hypothetical protein